jgi:beta-1,4-mannosyl-glycoprotein beta-1,4-N-acetylglucosaminyltransferase
MKLIDCFPFFNELDLLEIRLNELKDVVDVFVITESTQTFTGKDKPLFFQDNKDRFREFNIVNALFDDKTPCHPMERERRQKQFNIDYAYDNIFEPGDVIMYGDCDEIPKASVIKELLKQEWDSVGLILPLYYYYLNCRGKTNSKRAAVRLVRPKERIIYDLSRSNLSDKPIYDAGYHFSYLGDIKYKLESWGHAKQFNRPPFNDPDHIKNCMEKGQDLLLRKGKRKIEFEFIKDLSYLPQYVQDNMNKYEQYIHR